MTCAAIQTFAYRCTRCFHTLQAEVDDAGCERPCTNCGHMIVVPEATDERLSLAAKSIEQPWSPKLQTALAGELPSDEPLELEIQREMSGGRVAGSGICISSRWKRLGASLLDNALLIVAYGLGIGFFSGLLSAGLIDREALQTKEFNQAYFNAQAAIFLPLVALLLVQWNLIATQGQSLGKYVLGMRIVNDTGANAGFVRGVLLRSWLRAALALLPLFALIDWLVIFGEQRRCVHDFLAGTYVIDA